MAWEVFDNFMLVQHNGNAIDLDAVGALKIMLVDDTRAPVLATDANMTAIEANEMTNGNGYTTGGKVLANTAVDLATGTVTFDGGDQLYEQNESGFTDARYAILYDTASDVPICSADLGSDRGHVTGDLTLEMAATGIIAITNS